MRIAVLLLSLGFTSSSLAATEDLEITAPANGTIVVPGKVFTLTAKVKPFAFKAVFVGSPMSGFDDVRTIPPYRWDIAVPQNTSAGLHRLNLVGVVEPGEFVKSESVTVDVERPDLPVKLDPTFSMLSFDRIGYDFRLLVQGVFADGEKIDLTNSTYTTYTCDNPGIVTTAPDGVLKAVGIGSASLTISYRDMKVVVPLTVERPVRISQDTVVLHASGEEQFSAQVQDHEGDYEVVWSINPPGVGSIDAKGFYTAPSSIPSPQVVTVTATRPRHPDESDTAKVFLYPPATLSLAPAAISLGPSETHQFTATCTNPSNTLVIWSISPERAGTIDETGLYHAPDQIPAPLTVTVTAGAMTDPWIKRTATISLSPVR